MRRTDQSRFWLRLVPATFMLAWGGNHFTPLLHVYEEAGGYDSWQTNLLLGVYVAGLVPGLLIAAALSDQHGRKPIYAAGAILSIIGSTLIALGLGSFPILLGGRALSGVGVGVAMSVGTSWMKELSSAPYDSTAGEAAGARRPALTLTLGFGVGAAVAGVLGQWAPAPTLLPFVLHSFLTSIALVPLAATPESVEPARRTREAWWRDLRVPSASQRGFVRLIVPAAPWVFAAAGVAYAILPAAAQTRLGESATIYAALLTVLTLGSGAAVQAAVPIINRMTGGRALVVGQALMAIGMVLASASAGIADPVAALLVAILLGCAYGICVVAGLIHVQAMATPYDLAGLTGVYYSLAYAGFLLPTVLAALLPVAPYAVSLSVVAALAIACLALVASASRGR